jgi:hypothetical protein
MKLCAEISLAHAKNFRQAQSRTQSWTVTPFCLPENPSDNEQTFASNPQYPYIYNNQTWNIDRN